jgi:hypothetical protein
MRRIVCSFVLIWLLCPGIGCSSRHGEALQPPAPTAVGSMKAAATENKPPAQQMKFPGAPQK